MYVDRGWGERGQTRARRTKVRPRAAHKSTHRFAQATQHPLLYVPFGCGGTRGAAARMSRLGPLPPITVSMDVKPEAAAPSRSAEQQADLDFELDALHQSLGVKRGDALKEALKPKLECPMPPIELATPPIGEGISCHAPVVPAAQTNTEPAEDALR